VGSLIAVAWQLRSLAKQTREAARQSKAASEAITASFSFATTEALLNVDQFLADRPAVRRALYGPMSLGPDDDDAQRAEAAAEMLVDMYEGVMTNRKHLTPDMLDGWLAYIGRVMLSPVARDFWAANRSWYGKDVQEAIDRFVTPEQEPSTQNPTDSGFPVQRQSAPLPSREVPPQDRTPGFHATRAMG
jgi:hypothetical protein